MNEMIGWWRIATFCNNKGLQCNYNDGESNEWNDRVGRELKCESEGIKGVDYILKVWENEKKEGGSF